MTCSDDTKKRVLKSKLYNLGNSSIAAILSSFSIEELINFLKTDRNILDENGMKLYEVTSLLSDKKQLQFVSRINELDLNQKERRLIIVELHNKVKAKLDTSKLPEDCLNAVNIQIIEELSDTINYGNIIVDFNQDIEIYRDLDELMYINPMNFSDEQKVKFLKLCEICPKMKIQDGLKISTSTVEEYKNSEKWISDLIEKVDSSWSNMQKIAYIDTAIGKKISYSPKFMTEIEDSGAVRALWKIIDSGYGVCNGIAQIEKYILEKLDIESEMISGKNHSFLKLKNIEIPRENGESVKGNTILDPTWNLTANRFGCRPDCFCVNYDEIRKKDITSDGKDRECHKNDEKLADATLNLEDKVLREIYTSIGIADKDGKFPVKALVEKSNLVDSYNLPAEEAIKKQFELLYDYYPEFAECQNSTIEVLKSILLNHKNFNYDRCVINRVYEKEDSKKQPVMYIYIDFPEAGKKFYFADKTKGEFIELGQKEFEDRFECYEKDMKKYKGIRPWENGIETKEELNTSSGKVIAQKGEER